jgi:signal transduction histidine kinase
VTRRARRVPAWAWDALLTAAFAVLVVADLLGGASGASGDSRPATVADAAALTVIAALPLVRRRWPLGTIVVWCAITVLIAALPQPPGPVLVPFVGLFVFPYTAGSRVEGARSLLALPPVWVATGAVALSTDPFVWGDIFFPAMFGTLFWLGGRAVRSRSRLTAELHEAAARADEEREASAARAMAEERRRIAREMHDVVAHSVSMMVIQAGGARRILEYRVVQEALTNVLKHGGGAAAEVRVHYGGDAVEVSISDRGGGAAELAAAGLDGGGSGLVGMRERVRVCGGELHTGRRRGGGFEVRARLPLQDEDDAALAAGAGP